MKPARIDLSQQLASVPIRNARVHASHNEDGQSLVVEVDLRYPGWLHPFRRVLHLRPRRRYRLDGIGLEAFESIDGHKTFEALIDQFAAAHRLTFFEARALLMNYIQILMKRGLVVIGLQKPGPASAKQ